MMTATLRDPRLTGAFTAIVTPFTPDGSALDHARLDRQIAEQARGGIRGLIIAGTTGESPTLAEAEFQDLARRAIDACRRHKLLAVLGTGSNSTAHAVELQRAAKAWGADATLSVNPYYNKPTQEGLYRHFSAVADAAQIPVMLYNIPGRTGVALTPETVERLARHPNIAAIKEATGSTDSCGQIAQRCPELAVLSGDDGMTLPFMALGAVGVVSVISNILPARVTQLCQACLAGRGAEALAIHRELAELCRVMFLETNPIPVKAAMKLMGTDSGALRLPMCQAGEATAAAVRRALAAAGLPA